MRKLVVLLLALMLVGTVGCGANKMTKDKEPTKKEVVQIEETVGQKDSTLTNDTIEETTVNSEDSNENPDQTSNKNETTTCGTKLIIHIIKVFTIDCKKAHDMTNLIDPKVVIPMHYSSKRFGYEQISGREEFVELIGKILQDQRFTTVAHGGFVRLDYAIYPRVFVFCFFFPHNFPILINYVLIAVLDTRKTQRIFSWRRISYACPSK